MTAAEIIKKYLEYFEESPRNHKQIPNSSLIPEDKTTLFTSAGMQPLITYLLGKEHESGNRLVNIQNCFRAQDIDEVGDNRHTTFFRMLGNWSLGDYFKKDEIPWLWEFLTVKLGLPKEKLYITVFKGSTENNIEPDNDAFNIWSEILQKENLDPENRIFWGDVDKNWWSRSGIPDNMPAGEPGGPDTEVYFKFDDVEHTKYCEGQDTPILCECGKFLEIANSVFMQYIKKESGFEELPKRNVDFGGGLERLLAAAENKSDVFQTNLYQPIINKVIESYFHGIYEPEKNYKPQEYPRNSEAYSSPEEQDDAKKNTIRSVRIITDHFISAVFIIAAGISPSNKEEGSILRRLIRGGLNNFYKLGGKEKDIEPVIKIIVEQYKNTNGALEENYDKIKSTILEEENVYKRVFSSENIDKIKKQISMDPVNTQSALINNLNKYMGTPDYQNFMKSNSLASLPSVASGTIAFEAQSALGMPVENTFDIAAQQLGDNFIQTEAIRTFDILQEHHQTISREGVTQKFKGGLADTSEQTVMGHTATHLLHQALRDVLGDKVHQSGSNITSERIRFDFNYDKSLTEEELKKVEDIVNGKIKDNLEVHFEIMPLQKAKDLGAIGLFDEKYEKDVKIYFIGDYSKEFCGGPHVDFTGKLNSFRIIKQDNLGKGLRRLYAKVG